MNAAKHFLFHLFLLSVGFQAEGSPTGAVVKQLSSLIRWSSRAPNPSQSDGNVLRYENGYLVETVVEGNKIGVEPYTIRVSPEGELYAVDSVNSNIVRITPPLSKCIDSRARLVAGSFQGYSGHVDGKPSDARFRHPKGVTMDEKGNVYVADTSNLAIRKIGEAGVTTIAGGKSNTAGYRDGPSEDAKFSNDFDVIYVGSTCSLLVIDRGNAALRKISLQQEDCHYQYTSISTSDILMVIGAVLLGYASCLLQHGFGSSWFSLMKGKASISEFKDRSTAEKPSVHVEALVNDSDAEWPSFGRLLSDLPKLALEVLSNVFIYLVPQNLFPWGAKTGLTPLKDHLVMPEDSRPEPPPLLQKQKCPPTLSETLNVPNGSSSSKLTSPKPQKIKHLYKDPSLSAKHRSSKRHDSSEFYGTGETPVSGSKSQKERVRHRLHDPTFGSAGIEQKATADAKTANYLDSNFDNFKSRFDSYKYP